MSLFDYLTREDRSTARQLAGSIAAGICVLFTGAGVSRYSGLPSGGQLVKCIEQELGLAPCTLDPNDLALACTQYECTDGKSRADLITLLRRELDTTARNPAWIHFRLLDLIKHCRSPEILSTNVEDLWEKAFEQHGVNYCAIIEGADWRCWIAADQLVLIKLHGDLKRPDTLIFSRKDYQSYPKDEVISICFRDRSARFSIFFIGYSANDQNLLQEIRWVQNKVGVGLKPHFLVTAEVEPWRRKELAELNVMVIEVGDYARLDQLLQDLLSEVNLLRRQRRGPTLASVLPRMADLEHDVLRELFENEYESVLEALRAWRLIEAEKRLTNLAEKVQQSREKSTDIGHVLLDFHQRITLALANVAHWRGHRSKALDWFQRAKDIGPFAPKRSIQAASIAANLGDTNSLVALLAEISPNMPERGKLKVILAWLQKDSAAADRLIPQDTQDLDLLMLRARIGLAMLTEDKVLKLEQQLDQAWAVVQDNPPMMLDVAKLTEQLLRQVVNHGWEVPGLDRRNLLSVIRQRYEQSIRLLEPLKQDFPEGLLSAWISAMQFHIYLGEHEIASRYQQQLQALAGQTEGPVQSG